MLIATAEPLTTGGGSGAAAPAPLSFPDPEGVTRC
jgi:hypothetical protein